MFSGKLSLRYAAVLKPVSFLAALTIFGCGGGSDSTPTEMPEVNTAPIAIDDVASTLNSAQIEIDVVANDSDSDGDAISLVGIVDAPANGTAELSGSQIVYTPNRGYLGEDQFTYEISDGVASTRASVQVSNRQAFTLNSVVEDYDPATTEVTVKMDDIILSPEVDSNGVLSIYIEVNTPFNLLSIESRNELSELQRATILGDSEIVIWAALAREGALISSENFQNARMDAVSTALYFYYFDEQEQNPNQSVNDFLLYSDVEEIFQLATYIRAIETDELFVLSPTQTLEGLFLDPNRTIAESFDEFITLFQEVNPGYLYWFTPNTFVAELIEARQNITDRPDVIGKDYVKLVAHNEHYNQIQNVFRFTDDSRGIESTDSNQFGARQKIQRFSWSSEDDESIELIYDQGNETISYRYLDLNYVAAIWGEDVAQYIYENPINSQLTISERKFDSRFVPIFSSPTATLLIEDINNEWVILYSEDTEFAAYQQQINYHVLMPVSQSEAFTAIELEGNEWIIPSHLNKEYYVDGELAFDGSEVMHERWQLTQTGDVSSSLGFVGQWQISEGKLIIEYDSQRLTVEKIHQTSKATLALISLENTENGEVRLFAGEIAQAKPVNIEDIALNLELPFVWQRLLDFGENDHWERDAVVVDDVSGFKFELDGGAGRIYTVFDFNGEPRYFFNNKNRFNITYRVEGNSIIMNSTRTLDGVVWYKEERRIEVIEVIDENNFRAIEYSVSLFSSLFNGEFDSINPRPPHLYTMTKLDLSQYGEVWETTVENGFLDSFDDSEDVDIQIPFR